MNKRMRWIITAVALICAGDPHVTATEGDAAGGRKVRAASRPGPIKLGAELVTAPLEPKSERPGMPPVGITDRVKSLGVKDRLYLVVRGLRADAPPGIVYDLYLDLPPDASRERKRMHRVGVINFFNSVGPSDGGAADSRFVSFDVTDLARRLLSEGRLRDKPVLTIAPAGKPADGSKPVVAEVSLAEP